jgi:hypothetical protein
MRIYLILIAFVVFCSCNKDSAPDCFKSNGKEASDLRYFTPFKAILVNDNIEIHLFQGNEYKAEVIGPKNLLPKIITSINDTTLVIKNTNKCNFVRGYKRKIQVWITLPKINYCENNSVSTFEIDPNFVQDTLRVRCASSGDLILNGKYKSLFISNHGNGNVILDGECKELLIYTSGLNFIYAQKMVVKEYVYVASLSLGDVYINGGILIQLDCHIHNAGNIYYTGNPVVFNKTSENFGKGKIIKLD